MLFHGSMWLTITRYISHSTGPCIELWLTFNSTVWTQLSIINRLRESSRRSAWANEAIRRFHRFSSLACNLYSNEYVLKTLWTIFYFCYFTYRCVAGKHQKPKEACCETIYRAYVPSIYTSLANSVFSSRFRFGFGFGAAIKFSLRFHFRVADIPFSFSWI